jgi:hypothetical protein
MMAKAPEQGSTYQNLIKSNFLLMFRPMQVALCLFNDSLLEPKPYMLLPWLHAICAITHVHRAKNMHMRR